MHRISIDDPIQTLTARICRNEHLEELFLEYLRISASMKKLKKVPLSLTHQKSLELVSQLALDAFLTEANKRYPIQELNGQIPELIKSVSTTLSKKFSLKEYFS
ncbi:hypothetical protein ACFLS7_03090 [Bacteroidota bacterium]